jgi:ureidoglycolate lyase
MNHLIVRNLDASALGDWAKVLPTALSDCPNAQSWHSTRSDFWHVHDFEPGDGGETEVLWVTYRPIDSVVASLEVHWFTQQIVVPLGSSALIQLLCPTKQDGSNTPDLNKIGAWLIRPGQGVCMMPGCWHASLAVDSEVTAMMLTRRSTTLDLVLQLDQSQQNGGSGLAVNQPETSYFYLSQKEKIELDLSLIDRNSP